MIKHIKEKLLTWLSRDHLTGLRASWPAQSQLKGRVERLASKEKKGRSVIAWSILLLSLVFTAVLGCVYYQNSEGIKAPLTQGEARIIFQRGIEEGLELSPDFHKAVQILGPTDPSIPSILPLEEGSFTMISPFGPMIHMFTEQLYFHKGIDLAVRRGTPVFAVGSGTIVGMTFSRSYGNLVTIDHENTLLSRYAHLDRMADFEVGDRVEQGQQIGVSGNTGLSTGPHLHLEIGQKLPQNPLYIGMPLDPGAFLPYQEHSLDHITFSALKGEDIREVYQEWMNVVAPRVLDRTKRKALVEQFYPQVIQNIQNYTPKENS
jgi:hypothetical protein